MVDWQPNLVALPTKTYSSEILRIWLNGLVYIVTFLAKVSRETKQWNSKLGNNEFSHFNRCVLKSLLETKVGTSQQLRVH